MSLSRSFKENIMQHGKPGHKAGACNCGQAHASGSVISVSLRYASFYDFHNDWTDWQTSWLMCAMQSSNHYNVQIIVYSSSHDFSTDFWTRAPSFSQNATEQAQVFDLNHQNVWALIKHHGIEDHLTQRYFSPKVCGGCIIRLSTSAEFTL